jgi:hypothetical protein
MKRAPAGRQRNGHALFICKLQVAVARVVEQREVCVYVCMCACVGSAVQPGPGSAGERSRQKAPTQMAPRWLVALGSVDGATTASPLRFRLQASDEQILLRAAGRWEEECASAVLQ